MWKRKLAMGLLLGAGTSACLAGPNDDNFVFDTSELGTRCFAPASGVTEDEWFNQFEGPTSANTKFYRFTCNYSPEASGKVTYTANSENPDAGNAPWHRGDTLKKNLLGKWVAVETDNQSNTKLDVYIPKSVTKSKLATMPIVVYIHGGGQILGNKRTHSDAVANRWVGKAIVISLNYTLRSITQVVNGATESCGWKWNTTLMPLPCKQIDLDLPNVPEQLQAYRDVANAVAWVTRYNGFSSQKTIADKPLFAARNGGSLDLSATLAPGEHRIILMGHSAGGIYASSLATQPHWLRNAFNRPGLAPNSVISGVISLSAPMHYNPCVTKGDDFSNAPKDCLSMYGESGDLVPGYLKPLAARLTSDHDKANFQYGIPFVWDPVSKGPAGTDGGYGDGQPDVPLWKHLSPLYHFVDLRTRATTPPMLLINGGSGCQSPYLCAADMGDPPVMSESAKKMAALAINENVAAVQPVLSFTRNSATCYAYPMHSGDRFMLSKTGSWNGVMRNTWLSDDVVANNTANCATAMGSLLNKSMTGPLADDRIGTTVDNFIQQAAGNRMLNETNKIIVEKNTETLWMHPGAYVAD